MKSKHVTILLTGAASLIVIIALLQPANLIQAQPEQHWTAHPMYVSPYGGSPTPFGYTPEQIRKAYSLNQTNGGSGTTIAIIDAYDTPNILDYFNGFSNQFGLPNNSTGNFIVYKMPGTVGTDSNWAMETCLDVEWAHAIAPNARILLVEAANESDSSLLPAIEYATNYPGVVAVSMSWGTREFFGESSYDSFFSKTGISFFASSGDDGRYVNWPAVSSKVIGVGGTTLTLNPDNTTESETAWQGSSGGVSSYIDKPSFQASFGTIYARRSVPDVSFNGDPSTGVTIYNGTWWKVGGTSAGAPQWAAIHALGLSVTNANLYRSAKTSYSYCFQDITSGHNNVPDYAATGYDLITGLGSPLTMHFDTQISITPASGPANGSLTISGTGFNGSTVNISYINPLNGLRISIANNTAVSNRDFTSDPINVTDLLQNNPAGDNIPLSDNITFSVVDNSNNKIYNDTYTEFRRGLTQVGVATAQGLFGNNTDLTGTVFAQTGDALSVAGKWFSPGIATVLWDNQRVGTAAIDDNGSFSATLTVPTTTTWQHTLTINDGAANLCVNITRVPTTSNDYVDTWHTSDYTVNLVPDSSVHETFYRINGGSVENVTANGQPKITVEGNANTLEYWSTWNTSATLIMELDHTTISGIKVDKTPPSGAISTYPTTTSTSITLTLSANDNGSGVAQMSFSNDDESWSGSTRYPYDTSMPWTLEAGDGVKTVYVQFSDNAGLISTYSCSVTLQTSQPMSTPHTTTAPTATPTTTPSATPIAQPLVEPSSTPAVPELSFLIVIVLMALSTLLAVVILKYHEKKTIGVQGCWCSPTS